MEEKKKGNFTTSLIKGGTSLGALLAAIISYDHNHSVFYAILHSFCSWGYVIYHLIAH